MTKIYLRFPTGIKCCNDHFGKQVGGKEMVKIQVNNTLVNLGNDKTGKPIMFANPWLMMKVTIISEARFLKWQPDNEEGLLGVLKRMNIEL
jgi:hypothetical protein